MAGKDYPVEAMRPGGAPSDWWQEEDDSPDTWLRGMYSDIKGGEYPSVLPNPPRTCPCCIQVIIGTRGDREHEKSCGHRGAPAHIPRWPAAATRPHGHRTDGRRTGRVPDRLRYLKSCARFIPMSVMQ